MRPLGESSPLDILKIKWVRIVIMIMGMPFVLCVLLFLHILSSFVEIWNEWIIKMINGDFLV
jgi:hypothetical protein